MKIVLTAAKPQQVVLMEENGYVFLDGKWISCNDIICRKGETNI